MVARVTADACGMDQARLFKAAGLAATPWKNASRVNQEDLTALWKTADELSATPDIGLGVLKHFNVSTLGPLAFKMMVAPTFRLSILEALKQISLVSEVWKFSMHEQDNLGVMKIRRSSPNLDITHHSYDAFICASARMMRDCFPNETYKLAEIWFAHPDFGLKKKYERLLNCQCRFNMKDYALCVDAHLLDIPLPSADSHLYQSLDSQLNQKTRSLRTLRSSIERSIISLLEKGAPISRSAVSNKLGIGERTLLRRLKDESLTYKEVEEQVFEKLARLWLQRNYPMIVIAEKLGYADATSLRKMLKRRTGLGVRELREH